MVVIHNAYQDGTLAMMIENPFLSIMRIKNLARWVGLRFSISCFEKLGPTAT